MSPTKAFDQKYWAKFVGSYDRLQGALFMCTISSYLKCYRTSG